MVNVAIRFNRNRRASASRSTSHHDPYRHAIPVAGRDEPSTSLML